jgi:flagellar hook-basal body complex protein FliE
MDIRSTFAAMGYAQARPATEPRADEAGGGFAQMARDFTETLNRGEATARAAMVSGADPHALVEALAASELAVETAVTVRDKVVEAYQEILRMPV